MERKRVVLFAVVHKKIKIKKLKACLPELPV
ncbi:Hypothetical protein Minf_2040 [Methylacidiphilum infernorum V4]|uniref:Uncharacterized protein n=1 Tax=Methylacidiphilum infernorum (isolate V4) TaxID=481448 RepID=B3DZ02_METI4|nr:Hypothetical protein Minf_2040 [Methylacidiphilum infernorum V4]